MVDISKLIIQNETLRLLYSDNTGGPVFKLYSNGIPQLRFGQMLRYTNELMYQSSNDPVAQLLNNPITE